jgi:hypothetical protein
MRKVKLSCCLWIRILRGNPALFFTPLFYSVYNRHACLLKLCGFTKTLPFTWHLPLAERYGVFI